MGVCFECGPMAAWNFLPGSVSARCAEIQPSLGLPVANNLLAPGGKNISLSPHRRFTGFLRGSRKRGRAGFMLLVSLSILHAFGEAVIVIEAIEISGV